MSQSSEEASAIICLKKISPSASTLCSSAFPTRSKLKRFGSNTVTDANLKVLIVSLLLPKLIQLPWNGQSDAKIIQSWQLQRRMTPSWHGPVSAVSYALCSTHQKDRTQTCWDQIDPNRTQLDKVRKSTPLFVRRSRGMNCQDRRSIWISIRNICLSQLQLVGLRYLLIIVKGKAECRAKPLSRVTPHWLRT